MTEAESETYLIKSRVPINTASIIVPQAVEYFSASTALKREQSWSHTTTANELFPGIGLPS